MIYEDIKSGRFYNGDTFEAMAEIPDGANLVDKSRAFSHLVARDV